MLIHNKVVTHNHFLLLKKSTAFIRVGFIEFAFVNLAAYELACVEFFFVKLIFIGSEPSQ